MIITEIYDGQGLGNQLWCYVTTRVIAKDRGYDFGTKSPQKFKGRDFLDLDFGQPVIGGTGPEGGPPDSLPKGIKHYYREKKIEHPVNGTDIRLYDARLINVPDNTKIDGIMQDEKYIRHRRPEIRKWLKVKEEYECFDYASDDICVVNFRGGEYVHIKNVFLPQKYWDDAISHMRKINKRLRFVVITDDPKTAKKFFPNFEVHHFSVAKDYVVIKNAHYLILSNSSFASLPAWLSKNLKLCIGPKYWSQYNFSDGYWGCGYNLVRGWQYLDRDGKLNDYRTCLKELKSYIKTHASYFKRPKIKDSFLVVSNYHNDVQWVSEYTDNYLIYDKSERTIPSPGLNLKKVIKSPNVGYNLYDYFSFIIDRYNDLPDRMIFTKGNVFPRHVSESFFNRIMNNPFFTPIEDYHQHQEKWPNCFFSSDGGFCEINNSWYLHHHPAKFFSSYNDFLKFCFQDPLLPRYIRFAPGANYIVPRENILKLPKIFYENLRRFVDYDQLPGEAHIIERALHTLWNSNFEIHPQMLRPVNVEDRVEITAQKTSGSLAEKLKTALKRITPQSLGSQLDTTAILKYRQKVKIYDIFTFFNELDLLEIRLNMLHQYVDYFVIIEATETFSGRPKELFFQKNKQRFKKYLPKIIHYVINDTPKSEADLRQRLKRKGLTELDRQIITSALTSDNVPPGQLHWLKEFYQKESIKKALVGLRDDDICLVSDVDEIWNPETVVDFRRDDIFKLRQLVYAYYLNNRSSERWAGTLVTKYRNIKNSCLNHLRTAAKTKYTYIENGGWHFTNQGGADQIRRKLESYGHQEYNSREIKSKIEERMRGNQDFVGRKFKFWLDESDLPKYLKSHKNRYGKLFSPDS